MKLKRKNKKHDMSDTKVVTIADGENELNLVVEPNHKIKDHLDMLEIHLDGPFGAPASNIFR